MDFDALRANIDSWAAELGFQQTGVTDVDLGAYAPGVRQWLADGLHGTMGYMERNLELRLHPELLEPQTCRVISARMAYLPAGTDPVRILGQPDRAYVSRYALGRDYHKVLRRRLSRLAARINAEAAGFNGRYRAFTDSAPVLEKPLGEKSGLGWVGKHTLLLHPDAGSWFFLGEIYTNLPLPVDTTRVADRCGNCRACMTVCPTGAIIGARQLDARRCISYLTIENRAVIPEALRPLMGNRIFGCDDCQLFCPWNRQAQQTREADFTPRHQLDDVALIDLFNWSEAEFLQRTEGSAIRRISYAMWQRNLAVALGNGPASASAVAALERRRASAPPLVAEHIDWALTQLRERAESARGNT